jgi:hypothetical protein
MVLGNKTNKLPPHNKNTTNDNIPDVLLDLSAPSKINAPVNTNTCTNVGRNTENSTVANFSACTRYAIIAMSINPIIRFIVLVVSNNKAAIANEQNIRPGSASFHWVKVAIISGE